MVRLFLFTCFFAWNIVAKAIVLDAEGRPSPELVDLFQTVNKPLQSPPALEEANQVAQRCFLRPKGSERLSEEAIVFYHKTYGSLSEDKQKKLLSLFQKIGDLDAAGKPFTSSPSYILIPGSTVKNLRERVMFLARLVEDDQIRLDQSSQTKIVFLLGDRPLSQTMQGPFDESQKVLLDPSPYSKQDGWKAPSSLPSNETELGAFVWDQLALPEGLREQVVFFIKAPKKEGPSRAQTDDTVRAFIDKERGSFPVGASFLVVSSNPFINYQTKTTELVFWKYLGEQVVGNRYTFGGVGPAAPIKMLPLPIALGVLWDNLARVLYTEVQLKGEKDMGKKEAF